MGCYRLDTSKTRSGHQGCANSPFGVSLTEFTRRWRSDWPLLRNALA